MALDEPKEGDDVFNIDGFQYVVDKEFIEKAKPIKVDYQTYGFKLDSSLNPGNGCKSCDTTGSCCE